MRSFMRNLVAMRQMKTKLRCLKPLRPYTVDFAIDARERVNERLSTSEPVLPENGCTNFVE